MKEFSEKEQAEIINQYTKLIAEQIHEKKVMANIDLDKLNRINQINLSTAFLHKN